MVLISNSITYIKTVQHLIMFAQKMKIVRQKKAPKCN
jgi:hypothetical protein